MPSKQFNKGGKTNFTPSSSSARAARQAFDDANPPIDTLYVGNLPKGVDVDVLRSELERLFTCVRCGHVRTYVRPRLHNGSPQALVKFESVSAARKVKRAFQGHFLACMDGRAAGMALSFARNSLGQGESLATTRAHAQAQAAASSANWRAPAQPPVPCDTLGPRASAEIVAPASSRVDTESTPLPHFGAQEAVRSEDRVDLRHPYAPPCPSGLRATAGDFVPSFSRVRNSSPLEFTPSSLPPSSSSPIRPSEPHKASKHDSGLSQNPESPRKSELKVATSGLAMIAGDSPEPAPEDLTQSLLEVRSPRMAPAATPIRALKVRQPEPNPVEEWVLNQRQLRRVGAAWQLWTAELEAELVAEEQRLEREAAFEAEVAALREANARDAARAEFTRKLESAIAEGVAARNSWTVVAWGK